MIDENDKDEHLDVPADGRHRSPWMTPLIYRIDAGEAEVGTRASSDGAFSVS